MQKKNTRSNKRYLFVLNVFPYPTKEKWVKNEEITKDEMKNGGIQLVYFIPTAYAIMKF